MELARRRAPKSSSVALIAPLIVTGICVWIGVQTASDKSLALFLTGLAIALLAAVLYLPLRRDRAFARARLTGSLAPDEQSVTISTDGIRIASVRSCRRVRWPGVRGVFRDAYDLRIEAADGFPTLIPLRAFAPGEVERFEAMLGSLWERGARDGEGSTPNAVLDGGAIRAGCVPPWDSGSPLLGHGGSDPERDRFAVTFPLDVHDAIRVTKIVPGNISRPRTLLLRSGGLLSVAFPVVLVAYIAQFVTTAGRSYFLQSIDGIIILLIAIGCVIWTVAPAGKLGANLPEDLHCFITVSLNPDGVTTTIRETDTVFAWDRITTIEERSGFVTFRHGEGILAYVPMHAFLDSAHRDAFVSAALAYRRGDRPGTSGIWPPAPAMRS